MQLYFSVDRRRTSCGAPKQMATPLEEVRTHIIFPAICILELASKGCTHVFGGEGQVELRQLLLGVPYPHEPGVLKLQQPKADSFVPEFGGKTMFLQPDGRE
eukprot:GHVU01230484.1.p1 GENE.GHVU01230484.1~~GHVU01230484.1.p1  ORF type:complete len:102 (-),score=8.68 GHVU01230484.1:109-414(-)